MAFTLLGVFRNIICESDSLDTIYIRLIKEGDDDFHVLHAIINEIRDTLQRPWRAILQHTLREANFVADSLAKMGASANDSFLEWTTLPVAVSLSPRAGDGGVSFPILSFCF